MKTQFDVIFDNGGGVTLQHDAYVHHYNDPEQAAVDAMALLSLEDPTSWEGDEPDNRITYDQKDVDCGGYIWIDADDLAAILANGDSEVACKCECCYNASVFIDKCTEIHRNQVGKVPKNNQEAALALCSAAEALVEIEASELQRIGVTLTPDDLLAAAGKINQPVAGDSVSVTDGIKPF